jgi:hypothetical protein
MIPEIWMRDAPEISWPVELVDAQNSWRTTRLAEAARRTSSSSTIRTSPNSVTVPVSPDKLDVPKSRDAATDLARIPDRTRIPCHVAFEGLLISGEVRRERSEVYLKLFLGGTDDDANPPYGLNDRVPFGAYDPCLRKSARDGADLLAHPPQTRVDAVRDIPTRHIAPFAGLRQRHLGVGTKRDALLFLAKPLLQPPQAAAARRDEQVQPFLIEQFPGFRARPKGIDRGIGQHGDHLCA